MTTLRILPFLLVSAAAISQQSPGAVDNNSPAVTRATLVNGLRVVLVRDALAPVVTIHLNVLAGGNQDPPQFPGMAHAQEHMAFRGCQDMTADQTSAIYAQLGDENNAETGQEMTQYYATVPSADLDVALEAQAKCFWKIDNSEEEWSQERLSLGEELDENLSDPGYDVFRRIHSKIFAGTPYAQDPLGTRSSLDRMTGAALTAFHRKWYAPSNQVLVVVGDIDPIETLKTISRLFSALPDHPVPQSQPFRLRPFASTRFVLYSDSPYPTGYIAYRLPGTDSPDYAAALVLADALGGNGSRLDAMEESNWVVSADFAMEEKFRKVSLGLATVAVARDQNLSPAMRRLSRILHDYALHGVPEELVRAARNKRLSQELFQANSIPGLADVWSNAIAAEQRVSPQEDSDAIRRVTQADVNRVARRYLLHVNTVNASLRPVLIGNARPVRNSRIAEEAVSAPVAPIKIPLWAARALETLRVPKASVEAEDMTLGNGIRLVVRTDRTTPTVTLLGSVRHNVGLQTPPGKEGVADLLSLVYDYGTEQTKLVAFDRALDEISAEEAAGYHFSLMVPKENFSRGLQLLAENELTPALSRENFLHAQKMAIRQAMLDAGSSDARFDGALAAAMVPAGDPTLRKATPKTLSTLTLQDLRRHYYATIRPDLTTIVVVGDISPERARTEIERWFGGWRSVGPMPRVTLPPIPSNKAAVVRVADVATAEDSVVLAQELPLDRFSPDYYPLQLGTQVLDGGILCFAPLSGPKTETGYVYSVNASLSASDTRAVYAISYDCDPKNIFKVQDIIERDIDAMRREDISQEELHQAKSILLRQLTLQAASQVDVAKNLLEEIENGLPLDEPVKAANRYMELDAAAVRNAFARSIAPDRFVQVVLGSLPTATGKSNGYSRRRTGKRRELW